MRPAGQGHNANQQEIQEDLGGPGRTASPMESDEEEENEASNISGGYNYYTYREKPHIL